MTYIVYKYIVTFSKQTNVSIFVAYLKENLKPFNFDTKSEQWESLVFKLQPFQFGLAKLEFL